MEELFKDIVGYEGLYQVSNYGNVKSLSRTIKASGKCGYVSKERILKKSKNRTGYFQVILCIDVKRKTRTVHSLVGEAFLNHTPNGHTFVVNHKDLNKLNNNIDNLEIVTHRENSNRKHIKSSSKYTGVCFNKRYKNWIARIGINGKNKYLGSYKTEHEASMAYEKILQELTVKNDKI